MLEMRKKYGCMALINPLITYTIIGKITMQIRVIGTFILYIVLALFRNHSFQ